MGSPFSPHLVINTAATTLAPFQRRQSLPGMADGQGHPTERRLQSTLPPGQKATPGESLFRSISLSDKGCLHHTWKEIQLLLAPRNLSVPQTILSPLPTNSSQIWTGSSSNPVLA